MSFSDHDISTPWIMKAITWPWIWTDVNNNHFYGCCYIALQRRIALCIRLHIARRHTHTGHERHGNFGSGWERNPVACKVGWCSWHDYIHEWTGECSTLNDPCNCLCAANFNFCLHKLLNTLSEIFCTHQPNPICNYIPLLHYISITYDSQ